MVHEFKCANSNPEPETVPAWAVICTAQPRGVQRWIPLVLMSSQSFGHKGHLRPSGRNTTQELQGDPSFWKPVCFDNLQNLRVAFLKMFAWGHEFQTCLNIVLGSQYLDPPLIFLQVVTFIWNVSSGVSEGQCPRQKFSSPGRWMGHFHWAGQEGQGPRSPLCPLFHLQLSHLPTPPTPGLSFWQCCVNHLTELSSLHPSLPNNTASDMLIFTWCSINLSLLSEGMSGMSPTFKLTCDKKWSTGWLFTCQLRPDSLSLTSPDSAHDISFA